MAFVPTIMRAASMILNICAMPSCTSPSRVPTAGMPSTSPNRQLAGGRDLEAHLVLDVGDEDAVALAQLARGEVDVELRDDEQRQPLGARTGALGAGQHEVDDVVAGSREAAEVMKRLTPVMCQVPSGCWTALARPAPTSEPASGSVSTMVAPQPPLDHVPGQLRWSAVPEGVHDLGEREARAVHVDARVAAQDELGDGPAQARRDRRAAELDRARPRARTRRRRRPGSCGGTTRAGARCAWRGRRPAGCGRCRAARAPGRRSARRATSASISRAVSPSTSANGPGPEHLVAAEELEQGELEIAQVVLVVAHRRSPPGCRRCFQCRRGAAGLLERRGLPAGNTDDATGQ